MLGFICYTAWPGLAWPDYANSQGLGEEVIAFFLCSKILMHIIEVRLDCLQ